MWYNHRVKYTYTQTYTHSQTDTKHIPSPTNKRNDIYTLIRTIIDNNIHNDI